VRKLLRHPRLRGRVIASFSVLEVATKPWRKNPCVHVHTLAVTKPLRGRNYISQKLWIAMWEQACPQHRRPLPRRRRPRQGAKLPKHPSLVAKMVPRTEVDLTRVVRYCTKWATVRNIASDYRRLLAPNPRDFLERIAALKGIPKFFGGLHRKKVRKRRPAKAEASEAIGLRRPAQEGESV
jgi:hypothetical protein